MIPIAVAELNPVPAKADPVAGDDWMADLERDGFAVIKGAVPAERAAVYAEKAYDWLESLAMGFKRDDPRTGRNEHLPRVSVLCKSSLVTAASSSWFQPFFFGIALQRRHVSLSPSVNDLDAHTCFESSRSCV